jgi:hydroxyacylglutathione hydrolase
MLQINKFSLGPVQTNAYLVVDSKTREATVIDPGWDGCTILAEAERNRWQISQLWYTHAHFDHIGGAAAIASALNPLPRVALHPADHSLWKLGGGGSLFGFKIDPGPEPGIELSHGLFLKVGNFQFEVRSTPGHTPGHCVFYCESEKILFSGDLIFERSIGRTDLPGGDYRTLVESIQSQIFTLPGDTRLLPGHGNETSVSLEKAFNPFVGISGQGDDL